MPKKSFHHKKITILNGLAQIQRMGWTLILIIAALIYSLFAGLWKLARPVINTLIKPLLTLIFNSRFMKKLKTTLPNTALAKIKIPAKLTPKKRRPYATSALLGLMILFLTFTEIGQSAARLYLDRFENMVFTALLGTSLENQEMAIGAEDGKNLKFLAAALSGWPQTKIIEVKKGDTVSDLLVTAGAQNKDALDVVSAMKPVFNYRHIKPGHRFSLTFDKNIQNGGPELVRVAFRPEVEYDIVVDKKQNEWSSRKIQRTLSTVHTYAGGTIKDSLYMSGQEQDIPDAVMAELIRIYSFTIDFQREVRAGDQYEIMYEKILDETGRPVKNGEILYTSLTLSGKKMALYRYTPADTKITDYFESNGQSVKRALLRTPVDGARVSSGFGSRRHPILGYTRMHKGIDFAARSGTPIRAAGNGVVESQGWNGGYGRYVRIRHNNGYATAYAHMKGYGKGITKGARVKQGQIIGYVGTSGQSTGAHLHYEVLQHGKQVNPRHVKMPAGRRLAGAEVKRFETARKQTDTMVASLSKNMVIAHNTSK